MVQWKHFSFVMSAWGESVVCSEHRPGWLNGHLQMVRVPAVAPVTKSRERGITIVTPVTRTICPPPSLMLLFRADMYHKYDGSIVDLDEISQSENNATP